MSEYSYSLVHRDSVQGDDMTERKLTGKRVPQQVLMARVLIGESIPGAVS